MPPPLSITPTPSDGGGEDGGSRWRVSVKGHWRPSEDVKLRELVALHGPRNWNIISDRIPGRSAKSCRLRWVNQLDPRIKNTDFTKEEDAILMAAHAVFGNKWSHIAKYFQGRTDNAIKNHWNVLTSRRHKNLTIVSSHDCGPASGGSTCGSTAMNPLVSLKSNTGSSHVSGGIGALILIAPPPSMPFIDFLGVGE